MEISEKLPSKIKAWLLKGAGVDKFGDNGKPDYIDFPSYTEDDVIGRVGAVGICFSDVKLIKAGNDHPRIKNRDLVENPVIPGHEVILTIVGVGENRKKDFRIGERYIVQADVYYKGKSVAFGYVLPGGYSEYTVIGKEILDGDEGCYLIKVSESTGYAEAALVEPWACVVASYQIERRRTPQPSGVMFVGGFGKGQIAIDLAKLENYRPSKIYYYGLSDKNEAVIREFSNGSSLTVEKIESLSSLKSISESPFIDDAVVVGIPSSNEIKAVTESVKNHGIIGIHSSEAGGRVSIDIGSVHYRQIGIVASSNGKLVDSYTYNTRNVLKKGGKAWFVGGAGPMGQMHVIKAIMDPNGPSEVLISDLSDARIQAIVDKVAHINRERKVKIETLNPGSMSEGEFNAKLREMYPEGIDDIVILVPVAGVVSHASQFLARDGMMNVFAGVGIGTYADFAVDLYTEKHIQILGSSGSPLRAMKTTLELVESGLLSTNLSLAALADMDSVGKGIQALIDGTYNGKVVVFPRAKALGIKAIEELAEDLPEIKEKLIDGKYWTNKAEEVFLNSKFFK